MRAFDASAVGDVAGIDLPVDDEVRELAATIDAGVSTSSAVGEQFEVIQAATDLWGRATEAPASVRAVAPTLERALRAPERGGGDATVTDLYVSGVRERRRETVSATLESIAGPALVRGYEASEYSLRESVGALGETLVATTTPVVRKQCLRTLAAVARARPGVVRSGLDADAVRVAVEWLHANEDAMQWEATAVAELLVVALPTHPSVWDAAPVPVVLERLLEHEAAVPRALAQVLRSRAPEGVDVASNESTDRQSFPALRRLAVTDSLDEESERREHLRALGRCIALAPDLVPNPPGALVERVRMAPREDRAVAATALAEVVAHSRTDERRVEATLVDRIRAAEDDARDRRVRALGEVAVACPERLEWVPDRFRERVGAAPVPSRSAVRAVGETVVAASDGERVLDALRRRVRTETGPAAERATTALGEWVAHVPGVVDAPVESLASTVRDASEDERVDAAAVLGASAVVAIDGLAVREVVDGSESVRAARVRGERALAGGVDAVELDAETRARVRGLRGRQRRYATRALGVATGSGPATGGSVTSALREAVTTSPFTDRPTRLRLLGEWVAATRTGDRGDGRATGALAERVRETTGRDRERAARALGLATMECDSDGGGGYEGVVAEVVARLTVRDEARSATRRAVERATVAGTATRESLPSGVPAGDRDWSVRALGELVAVAPGSTPSGAASLAETVAAAAGWDRQSAARALGVAVLLDAHGAAGINAWTRDGLAAAVPDRGALMYVLGEVAAVHPEQFPGVPDAFVASVRDATEDVRTTTARALGEYVCQPTLSEPSSARALGAAAAAASGDTRETLTCALGETLVAVPEVNADVPASLVDAVAAPVDQDRRALARLLGELAVSDDPCDVLERMAPTSEDDHVFERARRSRMTRALAATDAIDVDDLLGAVPVAALLSVDGPTGAGEGFQNDDVPFDPTSPIRNPLLGALTATLERDGTAAPDDLSRRLDAWLRDATDAAPTARLHAMAARSTLDTTAAGTDP
ncbi:hypothetical protein [Halorubellus litoreus]|uniref:HEAT repeat-containing protein n=1 Tax=Halorubellus litoreus TaxID=755308 RepID=A0ABD5VIF5_9EURY